MDDTTSGILIALAAAIITAVIQYVQKKQGFSQGDKLLAGWENRLKYLDTMAVAFPSIQPDVVYVHAAFDRVKAAWNDSRVKDTELQSLIDSVEHVITDVEAAILSIVKK